MFNYARPREKKKIIFRVTFSCLQKFPGLLFLIPGLLFKFPGLPISKALFSNLEFYIN